VKVYLPQQLYVGPGQDKVLDLEFSPDGQKLAFWINGARQIIVHDFATGLSEVLVSAHGGVGLAWHSSGKFLYYYSNNGLDATSVFRVPTDQGPQERGVAIASYREIQDIDTSRPGDTGDARGFMVSYRNPSTNLLNTAFYSDDGTTAALVRVNTEAAGGALPSLLSHYNCDNTRFIYRISASLRRDVRYYDIATKQTTGFSTDGNINFTDWMPCAIPPS
jgi:WD40 repeat protein